MTCPLTIPVGAWFMETSVGDQPIIERSNFQGRQVEFCDGEP